MSLLKSIGDWLFMPLDPGLEIKGVLPTVSTNPVPTFTPDAIRRMIEDDTGGVLLTGISAVHACVRVIAEGLAKPPCYVHQAGPNGKALAKRHPLYYLLNASPNSRQTSYEFRQWLAWNAAIDGNAYTYIERANDGSITALLPCDAGLVSTSVDQSRLFGPITYYLNGKDVTPNIWHFKGPSSLTYQGQGLSPAARNAIMLAAYLERFGTNLFVNGAKPSGIIQPAAGISLTIEQTEAVKAALTAANVGIDNAHRNMFLPVGLTYTPMSTTANDSQWIEARRFQLEEICRFFRVSPEKVFADIKSKSYNSVEQAHIAHNEDTDAQWAERFTQSANKALLSDKDRVAGYEITLDHRAIMRGTTAQERMAYWTAGIAAGMFTQNEARDAEGYDPSDDPQADKLIRAANIMGLPKSADGAQADGPTVDSVPKKV